MPNFKPDRVGNLIALVVILPVIILYGSMTMNKITLPQLYFWTFSILIISVLTLSFYEIRNTNKK